jgi:hypothetical protein
MGCPVHTTQFDSFPCSFFFVGKVEIKPDARELLSDEEIIAALNRHTRRDFGDIAYDHHVGNIENIAESRGVVTSIYRNRADVKFYITTWLDDFDPHTCILIP